jgi:hypothetical protein
MCHLYLYYYLIKTATFDISSRKDGTDHFHHRSLKIDMDNIKLQVKTIVSSRFDLGQAWWRKIQNLGLANEYKDSANSETGKWLTAFFGLAFLPYSGLQVKTIVSIQLNNTRQLQTSQTIV